MHLIRFALFLATLGVVSLFFPTAAGGMLAAKGGGGGGGKIASIFDPLGSALGLHDAILGGGDDAKEPADPTAPPATSPAAATAAETAAAAEADRLAKVAEEEEKKRRALAAQTSLTGPLGLTDSTTHLGRPSLLG